MNKSDLPHLTFLIAPVLVAIVGASSTVAAAHEAHKMECNETTLNGLNADIQSMNDGEGKSDAVREMKMAEDMIAKKDLNACVAHMQNAREALER